MKRAIEGILVFGLVCLVYRIAYIDGYQTIQFDIGMANRKINNCMEVIRGK